MASVAEPTYRGDDSYRREDRNGRDGGYSGTRRTDRGFFISTEARPAFVTSEFWLTLVGVAGLVILAYASDALGVRWGVGFAAAVLVAFVLSRGIAKAGSSEVVRRTDND